jgi:aspartyl-tRNA(Asn)/glutamyl-tRNA(Gln) amidotransferase subunit A
MLSVPDAVARIRARNSALHAFVSTRLDEALAEHAERLRESPRSALHGVPYSLKDSWDIAGTVTTGGSHRYRDRVATRSTNVYEAFSSAGAVLVGKTNLSDLALTPECASYVGDVGCNPHALDRTTGGSSGGAAAAVADGMVAFDWGSDFGGSIRIPSAYCGVLGMRLSSEAWPMVGDFPSPPPSLHWMNGQGPITPTIRTMREVLAVAAPSIRARDAKTFEPRGAFVYAPGALGRWPSFKNDVVPILRTAIGEVREDHGLMSMTRARNIAVSLLASHFEDLLSVDVITLGEGLRAVLSALAFRGRFGDRRFHPHTAAVLLLIALGRVTLYRDRHAAARDAEHLRSEMASLWDRGYVIVSPSSTVPAPRHGGSFRNMDVSLCTMPGNVTDATALAIPFGRFDDGLPRSIQIQGPPGSEDALLDIAERILRAGDERDRFRA